jgi:D-alanyl-lipoteichoic acid acyltransferase DltB (MBOAT superfamily)
MLFTSWSFLIGFLPLAIGGYALVSRYGRLPTIYWLIAVSLLFYGWWAPHLIVLISCSIAFNYAVSVGIRANADRPTLQKLLLICGISGDLAALIYYKYAFAVISFLSGYQWFSPFGRLDPIVLPLGISFFTFTQIGYLVDCKDGVTKDNSLPSYILFVTFFPHLIAGPILHNGEMMPQFAERANFGLHAKNVAPGLTLFVLGMLKKSLLADTLSPQVASGFGVPDSIQFVGAWIAVLSYSMQLYFDFSGYSDMAIGLALLFNFRFPPNFNSPYKARNIIDFWQRWHMTLTRYITQYIYNPIAMSQRRSRAARGLPLSRKALQTPEAFLLLVAYPMMATMALAGIWHGAGLQFLVFGVLHGLYLTINHAWRMFGPKPVEEPRSRTAMIVVIIGQMAVTYLAVLVGQVFFRAGSCAEAVHILAAMLGLHGFESHVMTAAALEHNALKRLLAQVGLLHRLTIDQLTQVAEIVLCFCIVWFLPNTQQIMAAAEPILGRISEPAPRLLRWQPNVLWALVMGFATLIAILSLGGTSEFLYFQF